MTVKKSGVVKEIASERIKILYRLAKESVDSNPDLSRKYAKLIKKISRHYRIRLDNEIKRHICKKCGLVLIPGNNMSVRIASSKKSVIYKCKGCGYERKIIY